MSARRGRCRRNASRSGSTLRLTPWKLTQWRTRMPMLAILASPTKTPICPSWALALDAESRQRGDEPVLQRVHESAHVAAAAPKIEHHIGDALARTMIGEAAAAAGRETLGTAKARSALPARRWFRRCRGQGARAATRPPARGPQGSPPRARPWPRPPPRKGQARGSSAIRRPPRRRFAAQAKGRQDWPRATSKHAVSPNLALSASPCTSTPGLLMQPGPQRGLAAGHA